MAKRLRKAILACFATLLALMPAAATRAAVAQGIPAGRVYATDTVAYVDGFPITSYNIGGRTAIACEDLARYGFYVHRWEEPNAPRVWTGAERTPDPSWSRPEGRPGAVIGSVYKSGVRTYFNGLRIPSYTIDGKTVVVIEDLAEANPVGSSPEEHALSDYLFSMVWDPESRTINLYSLWSVLPPTYEPICVMYDSIGEDSVGLTEADEVYEWFRPLDSPQGLAVFTGEDWEAGPVGTLSLGAADIALLYGRAVCSEVTRQARDYLDASEYRTLLIQEADGTVTGAGAKEGFGDAPHKPIHGRPVGRGNLDPDAIQAKGLAGTYPGGHVAFSWRWNGKEYERTIGSKTVTATAVVVFYTFDQGEPTGFFPDGVLHTMMDRAVVAAEGRVAEVTWTRYPGWYAPVTLEDWSSPFNDLRVGLPPGRIWYEIVTNECVCSFDR